MRPDNRCDVDCILTVAGLGRPPASGELEETRGKTVPSLVCLLCVTSLSFQNSLQPPGLTPRHSASVDLEDVSHTEAGTYQCVGNNGFGQPAIDSVQVIVKRE